MYGRISSNMYLYSDATVEYFGKDHLPYGIVAALVLVVFIICPVVLLCVYPCHCFQSCLNRCTFQCRVLHTFMDIFQGGYKDGTNGTRDCRYFAAVYLMARIAPLVFFTFTLSAVYFIFSITFFILLAMSVGILRPYKSNAYNIIDLILVLVPAFAYMAIIFSDTAYAQVYFLKSNSVALVLGGVALAVPVLYLTGVVLYRLIIIVYWRSMRAQPIQKSLYHTH